MRRTMQHAAPGPGGITTARPSPRPVVTPLPRSVESVVPISSAGLGKTGGRALLRRGRG
jgi:hypothetical protein